MRPSADPSPESAPPLYVDLDGTLIASDLLWESLCRLAHREPLTLLRVPLWLGAGRARLKRALAERAPIDVATLPYRREVLEHLRAERARGRRVVLATASDATFAREIAEHLGLFDGVLASDGSDNVKGAAKLAAIRRAEDGAPFEYVGDAAADLDVWRGAAAATLVAPSAATRRAAQGLGIPVRTLAGRTPRLRAALRALRPHQWVKNALLFVPLLLAHRVADVEGLIAVTLTFVAFSAVASATYVLNDLLDIEADRRHPRKRSRPFAAGALPIPVGVAMAAVLGAAGFALCAALVSPGATAMLGIYLVLTTAYSFYFKEQLFLDVLILAGLYTHRVLAGGVAAGVAVSPWLLAFSMFFFLSLAFVKRYVELLGAQASRKDRLDRRGYEVGDIGLVENMGTTSGYIAVLVLCLYVSSDAVTERYAAPQLLWAISPVMLFWITRVWFLARRGRLHDDPVLFAATDPVSYLAGAAIAAVGVAAALGGAGLL